MKSAADQCREQGWDKGQLLLIDRSPWAVVIIITAVGEDHVLCKEIGFRYRGSEWSARESFEKCILRFAELYIDKYGGSATAIDRVPWKSLDEH